MDDAADKTEDAPGTKESHSASESAKRAALGLKIEAEKAIGEIKGRGIKGFFDFETMYFPVIARYVFVVLVVLSIVGMAFGALAGLVGIFSTGIIAGLGAMVASVIGGLLGIVFTRIAFEMAMLGFKMNEALQEIRENLRK